MRSSHTLHVTLTCLPGGELAIAAHLRRGLEGQGDHPGGRWERVLGVRQRQRDRDDLRGRQLRRPRSRGLEQLGEADADRAASVRGRCRCWCWN